MCIQKIKVKSRNEQGVQNAYVPCRKCQECRRNEALQWQKRLDIEIDEYIIKRNWKGGFFTLTYRPEKLPYIPKKFFDYCDEKYRKIPCFSYKDIKKFTDTIRNHLFKKYKLTDAFRFFIVCEYGEKYKRPHYHGIILYKGLSSEKMYMIIQDAWRGTTNEIEHNKKNKNGKRKDMGMISPYKKFELENTQAVSKYAAKYVCKDLTFENETKWIDKRKLSRKNRNELRHYQPFHKQSLGFGSKIIEGKSEDKLIKLLTEGYQLIGKNKKTTLPEYVKNKLLYINVKEGEHTTKRMTELMERNAETIIQRKIEGIEERYKQLATHEYWTNRKAKDQQKTEGYEVCKDIIDKIGARELAEYTVKYYGINVNQCRAGGTNAEIATRRYKEDKGGNLIDETYINFMNSLIETINGYISNQAIKKETDEMKKQREIEDYFKEYN